MKPPEVDTQIVDLLRRGFLQDHIRRELRVSVARIKRVAAYNGLKVNLGRGGPGRPPNDPTAYDLCLKMLQQGYAPCLIVQATGLTNDVVAQQKARFLSLERSQIERIRLKDDLLLQVAHLRHGCQNWAIRYHKAIDDLQALDPLDAGTPLHLVQDSMTPTKEDVLQACLDGRYERARALLHSLMLRRFPAHKLYDPRLPKPTDAPVDETSSTDPKP